VKEDEIGKLMVKALDLNEAGKRKIYAYNLRWVDMKDNNIVT
jgi:hypothetical protein